MKKTTILLLLLLLLLAAGGGMVVMHGLTCMLEAKPWYHRQTSVLYLPNGEATTVRVHVRNAQGHPVAGAEVCVVTDSGSTHSTTDKDGTAVCQVWEVPILGISVNDRDILRSYFFHHLPTGIDVYYMEDRAPKAAE